MIDRTLKIVLVVGSILLTIAGNVEASGQYYTGPEIGHCAESFWDSYGWLSYRNTCSESIHVVFQGKRGPMSGGMPLGPGREDSTGYSRSEIDRVGGVWKAVCPGGYIPVNPNGTYWDGRGGRYNCMKE